MRSRLLAGLLALGAASHAWALTEGQPAPTLAGTTLDGRALSLGDFRGRLVLLDFWASWCGPCAQSLPEYQRIRDKYDARGFSVVTVNVDTAPEQAAARRFLDRHAIRLPVIADPIGEWALYFRLPTMPSAYLIGRDGSVLRVLKGFRTSEVAELEQLIERSLQEGR